MWLAVWSLLLCVAAALSIAVGAREVAWDDIRIALGGDSSTFEQAVVAKRIPRTVLAALAGAALGVSGLMMQAITRNPIADPGILGVNTGASLAVLVGIAWFGMEQGTSYVWVAIAGSALTAVLVYLIAASGRDGATPLKLALAGSATSAVLVSFVTAVLLPRPDITERVVSWQIGGVGGATDEKLVLMAPFLIGGTLLCLWVARPLNLLGLGDDLAAGLGVHVTRTRLIAAAGAVALCGVVTAIAGPIWFVGLLIPHLFRALVGLDLHWLIPFCALGGAFLLLVADVVGRVVAPPSEVDVGILTAVLGAPVFIAIIRRARVREL